MASAQRVSGSFRDPSGFLFSEGGTLYRQVNQSYKQEYELLMASGLYDELAGKGTLIPHTQAEASLARTSEAYVVIKPERVPFISYPYEWSFSQLADAALLTLGIQEKALKRGLSLKDASAYNVQFRGSKPVFIDTLSFEPYAEGMPWVAYRQFCQHFLAPLALMSRRDVRLSQLLRIYIDGVPLDLASALLPSRTKWNFGLGLHVHMHARSQKKHAGDHVGKTQLAPKISRTQMLGLIDSLRTTVSKLTWKPAGTEWFDYYEANNNYGEAGLQEKERLVTEFLSDVAPKRVWDLGANTGRFSRLAAALGASAVAWDIDPGCVEANYRMTRQKGEPNVLPLVLDLTNPSPGVGWDNSERMSFIERGPCDAILALGLVHHLAIANNTPLPDLATFFRKLAPAIIVEFVPKEDSQVRKLLASRVDVFPHYVRDDFEQAFASSFTIARREPIPGTERTLYLMKGR